MPMIWIPQAEYEALQAVLTRTAQVDWAAYDRAKEYLLKPAEPQPVDTNRIQFAEETESD